MVKTMWMGIFSINTLGRGKKEKGEEGTSPSS